MGRDQRIFIHFFFFQLVLIWYEWKLIPDFCGYDSPSRILTLKCDGLTFQTISTLPFDFTGGVCSTNDDRIMMCFSKQNKKRCYKSKSPTPEYWWQFTLTSKSNYEHKSTAIALSSFNTTGMSCSVYSPVLQRTPLHWTFMKIQENREFSGRNLDKILYFLTTFGEKFPFFLAFFLKKWSKIPI